MNIKVFDKKIKGLKFIAHRLGFGMTNYPENPLNALHEIFENDKMLNVCDGFELDIHFTKDNIPVVIHDKYIDDISEGVGLVKSYSISELKNMNFGFRKSLYQGKFLFKFKVITLDEILEFFSSHKTLLKNKMIKIESKKVNLKNLRVLSNIINRYPDLSNNIIHLSFYPQNLIILKKIQSDNNYLITKTDLLCDYKIMVILSKIIKSIDLISLRIKTSDFFKMSRHNSLRVNKQIFFDTLFMKFSNVIDEKILKYAIEKYGSVGVYVLNNENDIEQFCRKISDTFFKENYDKIFFTTDNPLYIKKLK